MSEPRTVLVTGAASGIGRALAEHYAAGATTLLLLDRDAPEETAAALRGRVGTAVGRAAGAVPASDAIAGGPPRAEIRTAGADVRDAAAMRTAVAELAGGKPVDRVLHCAGVLAPTRPVSEVDPADVQRVVDINLVGSFNVVHAVLPFLRAGSHLGLVASMGGLLAGYRYVAYSSSKFGVVGLAETLRMELAEQGIKVQVICPGEVTTPLIAEELASGDSVQRAVKLMSGKPITAERAAALIARGVERGGFMVIPTAQARWLWRLTRLTPTPLRLATADRAIAKATRAAGRG
jgi:NAD(P)-dependent dehydrogenase (short-subunit alcohol dehydrogenase family)